MSDALVEYWKAFHPSTEGLNVHPKDREWLEKSNRAALRQAPLKTHGKYIASDRFGEDKDLHLSLLPLPYIGNLRDADVIIFLLNPGLSTADYYLEQHDEFFAAAIRNIRQEKIEDYPFIYLNPQFAWSSGFIWWEAKFRPIIRALKETDHLSYPEALQRIAQRVAAVELFPYHSVDGSSLGKGLRTIPSVTEAQNFLSDVAYKRNILKLVMRSKKLWLRSSIDAEGDHLHIAPATRSFTFNYQLEDCPGKAGKLLLQKLRKPK
jgi:hypothetical protein